MVSFLSAISFHSPAKKKKKKERKNYSNIFLVGRVAQSV
jgi:hypothetical protein